MTCEDGEGCERVGAAWPESESAIDTCDLVPREQLLTAAQSFPELFRAAQCCSAMFSNAQWCSLILSDAQRCSVMFRAAQSCSVMLSDAQWCSVMLGDAQSCSVMLRAAQLCSELLPAARFCSVMLSASQCWKGVLTVHIYMRHSVCVCRRVRTHVHSSGLTNLSGGWDSKDILRESALCVVLPLKKSEFNKWRPYWITYVEIIKLRQIRNCFVCLLGFAL